MNLCKLFLARWVPDTEAAQQDAFKVLSEKEAGIDYEMKKNFTELEKLRETWKLMMDNTCAISPECGMSRKDIVKKLDDNILLLLKDNAILEKHKQLYMRTRGSLLKSQRTNQMAQHVADLNVRLRRLGPLNVQSVVEEVDALGELEAQAQCDNDVVEDAYSVWNDSERVSQEDQQLLEMFRDNNHTNDIEKSIPVVKTERVQVQEMKRAVSIY